MRKLPLNVKAYKTTKIFTESTIPAGLLSNHKTMPEVWGKIIVLRGKLEYVIVSEEAEVLNLDDENFGVVEPQVLHYVRPLGSVEFYVEFYKE